MSFRRLQTLPTLIFTKMLENMMLRKKMENRVLQCIIFKIRRILMADRVILARLLMIDVARLRKMSAIDGGARRRFARGKPASPGGRSIDRSARSEVSRRALSRPDKISIGRADDRRILRVSRFRDFDKPVRGGEGAETL